MTINFALQSTLQRKLHVAIIMDGNRRWAVNRNLPKSVGHDAGVLAVRRVVWAAPEYGIGTLTLYAFSSENWNRPKREVAALMRLLRRFLVNHTRDLVRHGVKLTVIGRRDRLPADVVDAILLAEAETACGTALHVRVALDYSGRDAILEAAARATNPADFTQAGFSRLLTGQKAEQDVDLMIRTSGEKRLSDFLLWESAYAELFFLDKNWPDFEEGDLIDALRFFYESRRRAGRLPEKAAA